MGCTLSPGAGAGGMDRAAGSAPNCTTHGHGACRGHGFRAAAVGFVAAMATALGSTATAAGDAVQPDELRALALRSAALAAQAGFGDSTRAAAEEPLRPDASPPAAQSESMTSDDLVASAGKVTAAVAGVRSLDYPRLANIYLMGAVDESVIPSLARFDLLVLNSVWTNAQLARLRQLNPDIKLFVYVCAYALPRTPYAPNQLETDLHGYAAANDLWWYDTRQAPASDWPNTFMVNPTDAAPPGTDGTWRVWLVRRLLQHLDSHPDLDGIYLDNFWRSLSWAQPWLQLDSDCNPKRNAAGCNGIADAPQQLDAAWYAAMSDLAKRLRVELDKLAKRKFKQYGLLSNAASDWFDSLNGTMIENFPRGWGGDPGSPYGYNWNRSMLEPYTGYLEAPFAARPFRASILNADWWGSAAAPDRSPDFERHKRFTLASALLGDGFYSLGSGGAVWWEPEYDLNGSLPGYLGQPRGAAFRVLRPSGLEMIPDGDFSAGVGAPWRFEAAGRNAVLETDAAQFAQAMPSARITVRSWAGPTSVKMYMAPLPIAAGRSYTLRFSARSSVVQDIMLHLYAETCPGNRCLGDLRFRLGKQWRTYEYSFTSTGDGAAGLNLFLGAVGTVWLDDVSLRVGDTSVFRRDFERGIVLLNYTSSTQTIALGESFRRLAVAGSPVYDGTLVDMETLAPSDARILLRLPYSQRLAPRAAATLPAPAATGLRTAAPNPFNPSTRIAVDLAIPGRVSLRLHDVGGRLVRTLLDADLPAGSHAVTWDGTDASGRRVAGGIYLCTLSAAGARSTIKLVLVD